MYIMMDMCKRTCKLYRYCLRYGLIGLIILYTLYIYRCTQKLNRNDYSLEHMESLPQGATNTNLDHESGIEDDSAMGSELEDNDTPSSLKRVCC